MPWNQYICPICLNKKNIEIGNNITDQRSKVITCPCCGGKGYLHVQQKDWTPEYDKFWKRMTNNDKNIE